MLEGSKTVVVATESMVVILLHKVQVWPGRDFDGYESLLGTRRVVPFSWATGANDVCGGGSYSLREETTHMAKSSVREYGIGPGCTGLRGSVVEHFIWKTRGFPDCT